MSEPSRNEKPLPLSTNRRHARRQRAALTALMKALERCENTGVVILGQERNLFAFDEDRLFASGWTPRDDLTYPFITLGQLEVETHNTFVACLPHLNGDTTPRT